MFGIAFWPDRSTARGAAQEQDASPDDPLACPWLGLTVARHDLSRYVHMAFNLTSVAGSITKTVVAVLTLLAALLVVVGLGRAWADRRRLQVVVEDVPSVKRIRGPASSALSPELRQAVKQALEDAKKEAARSVFNTLDEDAKSGLLQRHGRLRIMTMTSGLRSATDDSLKTLSAGIRGVAPKQADGLLAVLAATLPEQRGWVVRAFPAFRGSEPDATVGLVLELAPLGHPPDAATSFYAGSADPRWARTDATPAAVPLELLNRLLNPAAAWIAIQLVSRQLAASDVLAWWRLLRRQKLKNELTGLQKQLAGQMSLHTMEHQKNFDRGFARQALDDLNISAQYLPGYFRPHWTMAQVRGRLARSYQRTGDAQRAETEFTEAVRSCDEAILILSANIHEGQVRPTAMLDRVCAARTRYRLLSGDRAQLLLAEPELVMLSRIDWTTTLDLYNASCLFAVALDCPNLSSQARSQYSRHAWRLLGHALLEDGTNGPWTQTLTDPDLKAMNVQHRIRFSTEIRIQHPSMTPLSGEAAAQVIKEAMKAITIDLSINETGSNSDEINRSAQGTRPLLTSLW